MTSEQALDFILGNVDPEESTPMTDENNLYSALSEIASFVGSNEWIASAIEILAVSNCTHRQTLEGFRSLLKRAWDGSRHHYARQTMPLYVAEACWKYNHRKDETPFDAFVKGCFT